MGGHYVTPEAGLFADILLSDNSEASTRIYYSSISVGGRYFPRDRAFAPWVGGGVSVLYPTVGLFFLNRESLFGLFGTVGLDLIRLNQGRLAVELRVHIPFTELQTDSKNPDVRDYIMPFSLGLSYMRGRAPFF